MFKIFLLLLTFTLLDARENPFFPATGELDVPLSTNQKESLQPLKRVTITLPSSARVIESVTVKYKNIDGSVVSKTEKIEQSVDWHLPLFLSQNYNDGTPIQKKKVVKKSYKKLLTLKFISIYESSNALKISTKDGMIRDFLLVKPHRIVCDFKREIDIRSFEKAFGKKSIVKRIKIGNHSGYYRVVIELDGYYNYKIKKQGSNYILNLG